MDNIYGVKYQEKQIAYNRTAKTRTRYNILGLIVHGTANLSKTADANAHYNYFNNGDRNYSGDYFVDNTGIIRINDWKKYYTWHIGDYKKRGLSAPKHGLYNKNTVSIEICVNNYNDSAKMKTTIDNTIKLACYLIKNEIYLKPSSVYRHFDVTTKFCPGAGYDCVDLDNPGIAPNWKSFKNNLTSLYNSVGTGNVNLSEEEETTTKTTTSYFVQAGAFSKKANAEALIKKLKKDGYNAILKTSY
jgi:N-acetylmuramoyl-L-alanine amidase CwlA